MSGITTMNKLGRNDPCWCGSNRKYKHCHLRRENEKELPFEAIAAKLNASRKHRICMHPDSPHTCNGIIAAHTLPKSRVLRAIIDSKNCVYTFSNDWTYSKKEPQLIGWNKASTFTAFCSFHDDITFAPLEKESFSGSKEQIFLIAYRAVCWSLYERNTQLLALPLALEIADRGRPKNLQFAIQELTRHQQDISEMVIADLSNLKVAMDIALKEKDYSVFGTYEIVMTGPLSVVTTGAGATSSPWTTELGFPASQDKTTWMAYGMDVRPDNTVSMVFLWLKTDTVSRQYVENLHILTDKELTEILTRRAFLHSENTYFATSWWDSLDSIDQNLLAEIACADSPNDSIAFVSNYDRSIAPWKIIDRRWL